MATRAIKPKRDDTMLSGWQSMPERAPSVMREDKPTVIRMLFMSGLVLFAVGVLSMIAPGRFPYLVNPTWGGLCLSVGLGMILFHAFSEKDVQFRRVYGSFGLTLVFISIALRFLPFGGRIGGHFLTLGIPGLFIGLLLFVSALRNETDNFWRRFLLRLTFVIGIALSVGGVAVLQFTQENLKDLLIREGVLELLVGLLYMASFITFQDNENTAYWASLGIGAIGGVALVLGVIRSYAAPNEFLVPSGFILMGFGVLYVCISAAIVSDWTFLVLLRRELSGFFFSPIAYLVLAGMMAIGLFNFWTFVGFDLVRNQGPIFEPIVKNYVFGLVTVIGQMFVVPVLTMRLLSEEQRSGTLEVLLTAPVNEVTVVLSKFFAALIFYLLTWVPWWIFLVGLWIMGGEPFDYRPVLTFNMALMASGAGFMAMGLFFSTMTRNQIIAAVLTFVGMMVHLGFYISKYFLFGQESTGYSLFTYISFLDLWLAALDGLLAPRWLIFHVSATVFFLFLSVKILEARKWR